MATRTGQHRECRSTDRRGVGDASPRQLESSFSVSASTAGGLEVSVTGSPSDGRDQGVPRPTSCPPALQSARPHYQRTGANRPPKSIVLSTEQYISRIVYSGVRSASAASSGRLHDGRFGWCCLPRRDPSRWRRLAELHRYRGEPPTPTAVESAFSQQRPHSVVPTVPTVRRDGGSNGHLTDNRGRTAIICGVLDRPWRERASYRRVPVRIETSGRHRHSIREATDFRIPPGHAPVLRF